MFVLWRCRCCIFTSQRQALVLTHELTPSRDFDTCLARRLAPVRPLLSYGRSAKSYPQAPAKVAVYSWWKDGLTNRASFDRGNTRCTLLVCVQRLSPPPSLSSRERCSPMCNDCCRCRRCQRLSPPPSLFFVRRNTFCFVLLCRMWRYHSC